LLNDDIKSSAKPKEGPRLTDRVARHQQRKTAIGEVWRTGCTWKTHAQGLEASSPESMETNETSKVLDGARPASPSVGKVKR